MSPGSLYGKPSPKSLMLLVLGLLIITGCNQAAKLNPFVHNPGTKGKVIAKVFNAELYESDLALLNSGDKNQKDSIELVKTFINNWVKQQLLLKKADENLDEGQKNVEQQLKEYRNSLIIYLYEKELVRQKLDTIVTEEEMDSFYRVNKNNFEQKSNIIQLNYVKYAKNKSDINKIRMQMKAPGLDSNYAFIDYCQKNAANYFFKSNVWLEFNDVLKEIPIKTYDQEQFIQNNKYIEVYDDNYIYLVKILNFKIRNSISEFPFVRETIKTTILNNRKIKMIDEMERKTMEEALNSNAIKIY
jgi:hypothetical protein